LSFKVRYHKENAGLPTFALEIHFRERSVSENMNTQSSDRTRASALVAAWLSSSVTNQDFDDDWPWNTPDPAVLDIGTELWSLYDDFPKSLLDPDKLQPDQKELLVRCGLFLGSAEQYKPVERINTQSRGLFSKLLGMSQADPPSLQLTVPDERKAWWPFADEEQFRRVVASRGQ
jgi:hypothetical protein